MARNSSYNIIGVSFRPFEMVPLKAECDRCGHSPSDVLRYALRFYLTLDVGTRDRVILAAGEDDDNVDENEGTHW